MRCDGGFHPWFWGVVGHLTGVFHPCFAVCDGVMLGCGVMVVSTLGFGVLLCPWFPPPNDVEIASRIAMSSFSRIVRSWLDK